MKMSNVRLEGLSIFFWKGQKMINKHRGSNRMSEKGLRFKWKFLNKDISILQKRKKVSEHEKVSEHVLILKKKVSEHVVLKYK